MCLRQSEQLLMKQEHEIAIPASLQSLKCAPRVFGRFAYEAKRAVFVDEQTDYASEQMQRFPSQISVSSSLRPSARDEQPFREGVAGVGIRYLFQLARGGTAAHSDGGGFLSDF